MIFGIFLLNILLTIDQLIKAFKVGDSVSTKDEIPFYSCWPTNNRDPFSNAWRRECSFNTPNGDKIKEIKFVGQQE